MSKPILDLVGQKFGRLTVEVFVGRIKNRSVWQCLCDCGSDKRVEGGHLKDGTTTSCGCFHKEQTSKKNTTHGHYKNGIETPTHRSWAGMIQRCKNPKCKEFKYYGGNGRDVCDRWLESFENFLEDMGECPEGMSLERIDNTKGYYKENGK